MNDNLHLCNSISNEIFSLICHHLEEIVDRWDWRDLSNHIISCVIIKCEFFLNGQILQLLLYFGFTYQYLDLFILHFISMRNPHFSLLLLLLLTLRMEELLPEYLFGGFVANLDLLESERLFNTLERGWNVCLEFGFRCDILTNGRIEGRKRWIFVFWGGSDSMENGLIKVLSCRIKGVFHLQGLFSIIKSTKIHLIDEWTHTILLLRSAFTQWIELEISNTFRGR